MLIESSLDVPETFFALVCVSVLLRVVTSVIHVLSRSLAQAGLAEDSNGILLLVRIKRRPEFAVSIMCVNIFIF